MGVLGEEKSDLLRPCCSTQNFTLLGHGAKREAETGIAESD